MLRAIKEIGEGKDAPGLVRVREQSDRPFPDFICTSVFIDDDEDGPSYCRRALANQAAAAE